MANTFKLKTKTNVGVTTVGIYTAPSSTTTVVIGITCANTSGNESQLELELQEHHQMTFIS